MNNKTQLNQIKPNLTQLSPVVIGRDGIVSNETQLNRNKFNPIQLSLAVLGCEQQNPTQLNPTQPNPTQLSCHWLWWGREQRNQTQSNPTPLSLGFLEKSENI